MNKSKSSPQLLGLQGFMLESKPFALDSPPPLRNSISLDNLQDLENEFYFEEFFEGDGPLGIKFFEDNIGNIIVKRIESETVAAEYFGLVTEMILVSVNGVSVEGKDNTMTLQSINRIWKQKNEIMLKFKKPIYQEVIRALNDKNLLKYYDKFVELGAKSFSDFEFVEYSDLVGMEMSVKERERFKKINPLC
jgi:hypothetical protein